MSVHKPNLQTALSLLFCLAAPTAFAHGITSPSSDDITPAFDITTAGATTDGRLTTFMMEVAEKRDKEEIGGVITFNALVKNQRNEDVVIMNMKVMLHKKG